MVQDPSVGMCASKMVFPDGRINSTAICISRSGAAWDRGGGESDHGQYNSAEEMFGPCAGAALYRRSMLDEIGLFDEDFFLYMEDVDLAFRARLSGWKCWYVPMARVVHIHGGTAGFRSDISIYYGNRNLGWYVVKNFPIRTLLLSGPWIITRNCADIPYYILCGKGQTIVRAKFGMMKGFLSMVRKRKGINRRVPAREIEKWIHVWCRASRS
jgi:GT2 family glycosyltransferase